MHGVMQKGTRAWNLTTRCHTSPSPAAEFIASVYREYLEMAKIKAAMLNPSMLGLILQFLRQKEITAEAPQQVEMSAFEKRLEQKRDARERGLESQKIVNLSKGNRE